VWALDVFDVQVDNNRNLKKELDNSHTQQKPEHNAGPIASRGRSAADSINIRAFGAIPINGMTILQHSSHHILGILKLLQRTITISTGNGLHRVCARSLTADTSVNVLKTMAKN
jgi:hypothetical protein